MIIHITDYLARKVDELDEALFELERMPNFHRDMPHYRLVSEAYRTRCFQLKRMAP